MRSRWTVPGAVVVALLLSLLFCTDSQACGRGRCRQRHNPCCGLPCWVRCIDMHRYATCPSGTSCMCCEGGNWVPCDDKCEPGSIACIKPGTPVPACPRDYREYQCHSGCSHWICAMVCDRTLHVMRFALPCEEPDGY